MIDIDVEAAMQRIKGRHGNNRYENMDRSFHQKVHQGFLQIAKNNPSRIKIIDGTKPEAQIAEEIYLLVQSEK